MQIKINNKKIICEKGDTVLNVAQKNGIDIPNLCYHPDFCVKANCRVCVVEVKGKKGLQTSCSTLVEEGMEVFTNSEIVEKTRNMNLELIFAEHVEKCATCTYRFECKLLEYANRYKILLTSFRDRKRKRETEKQANAIELDKTQCIDCRNCIDACAMQGINCLEVKNKGKDQEISFKKSKTCILCGQCTVHCPVDSMAEQMHIDKVEKNIKDKSKIVVVQSAPSIRVSIGESFGLKYGEIATGKLVAALRKLGFNYVFDVNFGADVTTMVEAKELLERVKDIKNSTLPMFTSCCPAWVNYVEHYRPDLIPNLTTSRSPQIHNGGIIKTYWAEKMKISPKDIIVVSIMPCTAKKYEGIRRELKVHGASPVDYVLTTRELAYMIKKNDIDFKNLKDEEVDDPIGQHSGAAAIYGASGGVMESALRTAQYFADKKNDASLSGKRLEYKAVRGMEGIKKAVVDVAGIKVRAVVVNGIGNINKVLDNLEDYDYIEVMSCPGGCIGGGGQPIPTTNEIRKKRMAALYDIDKSKKIRKAHNNKEVNEILKWLDKKGLSHTILHTHYKFKKNYDF